MPELEAAYARLLRAGGRNAALNFRQQVVTAGVQEPVTVTAAVDPWQPPTGDLVDGDELAADASAAIAPIHRRILKAVSPAADLGIAFDVKHPTSQALLAGIGKRLGSIPDAIRTQVNETVAEGHAAGWSVAKTTSAIRAKVDEVTPGRAAMLARTDLNAISNGASLSAAQAVGVSTKTWLATNDEKTRETHAEADGQTVPLDQTFTVGGEQAQYPGDPDLSDEEAANCRCSLTYGDGVTASATTPEGGEMTDEPIVADAGDQETLAVLRETFARSEGLTDAQILFFRDLALAAKGQHKYAGSGGMCAICGEMADDKTAHFQALGAGLAEFTIVAAAGPGEPTRWISPAIVVEGAPMEDGRIVMLDALSWRDGVLPLGFTMDTPHGGINDAPVCGGIDQLQKIGGGVIAAGGFFNDNSTDPALKASADTAIAAIESRTVDGISVDIIGVQVADLFWPDEIIELNKDGEDELPPEVEENLDIGYPTAEDPDGDGDIDAPAGRYLRAIYEGVIAGACVCPVQAVDASHITVLATSGAVDRFFTAPTPLTTPEDCGCDDVMVASVLPSQDFPVKPPLVPPSEWFENPGLAKPTPLTITADGKVFGHVAGWSTCHEGFSGRCVLAPRSKTAYSKFHHGEQVVAGKNGESRVPVGTITLAAGHAGVRGISAAAARAHYDNTATIAAFVRAGEDQHGIWISGALKSDLPPERIRDLMASPLSGDWRNGELVAAHAVIDPGFPVLRASGLGELFEEDEVEEPVSALAYLRPGKRAAA